MGSRPLSLKNPRVQQALAELKGMILERYPEATFEVCRGPEDPREIDLVVILDVENVDDLLDVVMDRMVKLQIDERLPIHVLCEWTPERLAREVRRAG